MPFDNIPGPTRLSKTCAVGTPPKRVYPCKFRDNITVKMDKSPYNKDSLRITVECLGCYRTCAFSFESPDRLSFVFAAKLAARFSSLCGVLVGVPELRKRPDGQLNLLSNADE